MIFLGILVTGDIVNNSIAVELLWSNGTFLCSLSNLPFRNYQHTQSRLVTCGGREMQNKQSCHTLTNGVWTKSHTLRKSRFGHSSWTSPLGILLMGGGGSYTTTELLTDDGQSTELFPLQYDTK